MDQLNCVSLGCLMIAQYSHRNQASEVTVVFYFLQAHVHVVLVVDDDDDDE